MQTFVPTYTLAESILCLDPKRRNNQANDCMTILRALDKQSMRWARHPATLMWRDNMEFLALLGGGCAVSVDPNDRRKYFFEHFLELNPDGVPPQPWWWRYPDVHISHRLNLYWSDPNYYHQFRPIGGLPPTKPFTVWPIHHDECEDLELQTPPHPESSLLTIGSITLTRHKRTHKFQGLARIADDKTAVTIVGSHPYDHSRTVGYLVPCSE